MGHLALADPKRGEVWTVALDPTLGAEIKKTRPVVVVNSDGIGTLPLRIIVPITEWSAGFQNNLWHIKLAPDSANGLTKISSADVLQLRSVSTKRFTSKLGLLTVAQLEEIAIAIGVVVEIP